MKAHGARGRTMLSSVQSDTLLKTLCRLFLYSALSQTKIQPPPLSGHGLNTSNLRVAPSRHVSIRRRLVRLRVETPRASNEAPSLKFLFSLCLRCLVPFPRPCLSLPRGPIAFPDWEVAERIPACFVSRNKRIGTHKLRTATSTSTIPS